MEANTIASGFASMTTSFAYFVNTGFASLEGKYFPFCVDPFSERGNPTGSQKTCMPCKNCRKNILTVSDPVKSILKQTSL